MSFRSLLPTFVTLLTFSAQAQGLINVPADMSLQAAIDSVVDGGVIQIAAGTYPTSGGNGFQIADQGKAFTIRAVSGATVVLDGQGANKILTFINGSLAAGRPVSFIGLTFANGLSTQEGRAAGVTLQRGEATFENCIFNNNNGNPPSTAGGAVLVGVGSTAYFIRCAFNNNRQKSGGAAIDVGSGSTVYIHDSEFISNRTNYPNHLDTSTGGAIHVGDATLRLTNSRFVGNEAGYVGGAVYAIGQWQSPYTTPVTDVIIANCDFEGNKAKPDPSVTLSVPTEGGAFHAENQTHARIYSSRFTSNQSDSGAAVNLFRAQVDVQNSVFRGNTTLGGSIAYGGTFNALSNDGYLDPVNYPSARLSIVDSVVQGVIPGQTIIPKAAGCLFIAGDANRQYGENGAAQMGDVSSNRAVATITRTVFDNCQVSDLGGAMEMSLTAMDITDCIIADSSATNGGGVVALNRSLVNVTNTMLAKNAASSTGGALWIQGSTINVTGSQLVRNSATNGSAMYTEFDDARGIKADGLIQTSTLTENTGGVTIAESDKKDSSVRINEVQYNGNQLPGSSATVFYNWIIAPGWTVSQLNAGSIVRNSGYPTTKKSSLANNTAVGSNPAVGKILAVPPEILSVGARNETGPFPSYLGYAWGGATTATVAGASKSGGSGLDSTTSTGTKTLSVSGSSFSDSLSAAFVPTAGLAANPQTIAAGGTSTLSWSTPSGTFLDEAIDHAIGSRSTASGNVIVTPPATTTYRGLLVAQEGGSDASATVTIGSVPGQPPVISSFVGSPLLVSPGGSSTLSWATSGATSATLNGSPVSTSGSQQVSPSATTLYTLVATNSHGSSTRLATVNVSGGTGGLSSPPITAPTSGQVIGVKAVTFTWGSVSGAAGYDLRVFDASSGLTVFSGSLTGAASTSSLIELYQGSFLFAVRACNLSGFADASCGAYTTRGFSINPYSPTGAPTVTAPAQGSTLTVSTTALGWTAVTPNPAIGGLKYEVLLTDLQHGTTALQTSVPDPTLSTIFTMKSSTSYELKVRACQAGCGPWSTPVTFAVSLPSVPTAAPTITSTGVSSGNLTVTWTTVPGADLYQVQVVQPSGGPGGGALTVAARQVSATTVTFPVPTGAATVIVAACTGDGCGPNSGGTSISPAGSNPTLPNFGTPMAGPMVNGPLVLFTWSRIPGDTGSNTTYRLYAMDFARQDTALDVLTTNNYYGAMFKAEGTQYGAVVIANPDPSGAGTSGPSVGFSVVGTSSWAPTMVAPRYQGTVRAGNVTLGWTPVQGATLYNYYVTSGSNVVQGVTPGLFVQAPLTATGSSWIGIIRACPAGATCVAGSDTGWSPWSNTSGGTGVASFTVTP